MQELLHYINIVQAVLFVFFGFLFFAIVIFLNKDPDEVTLWFMRKWKRKDLEVKGTIYVAMVRDNRTIRSSVLNNVIFGYSEKEAFDKAFNDLKAPLSTRNQSEFFEYTYESYMSGRDMYENSFVLFKVSRPVLDVTKKGEVYLSQGFGRVEKTYRFDELPMEYLSEENQELLGYLIVDNLVNKSLVEVNLDEVAQEEDTTKSVNATKDNGESFNPITPV